jgi:hypothetical protein
MSSFVDARCLKAAGRPIWAGALLLAVTGAAQAKQGVDPAPDYLIALFQRHDVLRRLVAVGGPVEEVFSPVRHKRPPADVFLPGTAGRGRDPSAGA